MTKFISSIGGCGTLLAAFLLAPAAAAETAADPANPAFCTSREAGFEGLEKIASADPWFDVYRLDQQTFAIVEARQAEGIVSYLIIGRERAVLFDTGFGIARIDTVAKALTNLPITVLNSHSHYDHVGGNSAFTDEVAFRMAQAMLELKPRPTAFLAGSMMTALGVFRAIRQAGVRVAELILQILAGKPAAEVHELWPVELVLRESSGPAPQ